VISKELDFSLKSRHMLAMDLVGQGPKVTFPNHTCLRIFKSQVILIVYVCRGNKEIEVTNVEPETNSESSKDNRPNLEPTFRVNIIESPIRISFKGSPNRETM